MGLCHGGRGHGLPVGFADLQTGKGLQPVHEIGQQNGPRQVQRHQLIAVEQQQEWRIGRVLPRRDHVDADGAAALRVQRDMPHAAQVLPAVLPFQKSRHGRSSFQGVYLCRV